MCVEIPIGILCILGFDPYPEPPNPNMSSVSMLGAAKLRLELAGVPKAAW